jgi:hypothetical protein
MDDHEKTGISGKTATHVAMEAAKRGPIRVDQVATDVPAPLDSPQIALEPRRAPPRAFASHHPTTTNAWRPRLT